MSKIVSQMAVLIAGACILGAILAGIDYFFLAPGRVPACDSAKLKPGYICPEEAQTKWGTKIIWIDARSMDAFERSTLKVNPARIYPIRNDEKAQELIAAAMPRLHQAGFSKECIIVFCDKDCASSADVADKLRSFGLKAPIFVLEGGWDALKTFPPL